MFQQTRKIFQMFNQMRAALAQNIHIGWANSVRCLCQHAALDFLGKNIGVDFLGKTGVEPGAEPAGFGALIRMFG